MTTAQPLTGEAALAERLEWALDRLDECGKQIEFTLGMCRSMQDCRRLLSARQSLPAGEGWGEEAVRTAYETGFLHGNEDAGGNATSDAASAAWLDYRTMPLPAPPADGGA